jgi:hypothetical protein
VVRLARAAVRGRAVSGELEPAEAKLAACEQRIEAGLRSFTDIGAALKEIRDGKLYLLTHKNFGDYTSGRWDIDRTYAHRVIEAAEVVRLMLPSGNKKCPPPAIESHARALVPVPEQLRAKVWESVWQATSGHPTAKAVEAAVSALAHGDSPPAGHPEPAQPQAGKPQQAAKTPAPGPVPPAMTTTAVTFPDTIKPDPELAKLKQENAALAAKVTLLESVAESLTAAKKELEKQVSELAGAQEQIAALTAERDDWKARAQELEAAACGHDAAWHSDAEAVLALMQERGFRWDRDTRQLVQI